MSAVAVQPSELRQTRRRRVFAVLAGLSVLGIGSIVTLAAWNASDFATGTFTSGTFVLLGSTDNSTYAQHPAAPGATLAVTVTPGTTVSPGSVIYMPYALELSNASTNSATVTITNPAATNPAGYTYTMFTTAVFGCSSTSVAVTTLVAASNLGAATGAQPFTLAAPVATVPQPTYLCIKVTAGSGITQATQTSATWQFAAVSN